jgi:hypothetical protein
MTFTSLEWQRVDETLARAKPSLIACRATHGATDGDITFRLHYDGAGEIGDVTVLDAPVDVTADFLADMIVIICETIRFPRSAHPGVLDFTDLGADSARRRPT